MSPTPASSNTLGDHSPVSVLPGVGPKLAESLANLGLRTLSDLWFHLPLRYEDRTRIQALNELIPGQAAQVEGLIEFAEVRVAGRRSLVVVISDASGTLLRLRYFHFNAAQRTQFQRGMRLRCFGEPRLGLSGMEMVHPQYRIVATESPLEAGLSPVYPTTEAIHRDRMGKIIALALCHLPPQAALELLPETLCGRLNLMPLRDALLLVHQPPADVDLRALANQSHPAQRRLAFEELAAHQLAMRLNRRLLSQQTAPPLPGTRQLVRGLLASLPFALTAAQTRVLREIAQDLKRANPMLRLVQGDVGSGKTLVAACAALLAIESGAQAALLAPTELLAEQHLQNFTRWFVPLGIEPVWLVGKLTGRKRAQSLAAIASGAPLVIGTHALIQDAVQFQSLGLVIVDEQHRFGVRQRLALRDKGHTGTSVPHQLVMTATPIPRTLAMVAYADLDVSVIDELPPGRTPVQTVAIDSTRRADVVARIHRACAAGRQAYWVCTLIEESDQLQAQAAEQTLKALTEALPDIRIAMIHGRMKPSEKQAGMAAFARGETQVLIATTVIEVGVDVPNASLMVIENAERLGLSQLHQLRGRVGRGSVASACVLLYQAPMGITARQRLQVLRESNDGFVIAEADLRLRGPGEFLGARQAGFAGFRIAHLERDQDLLPQVREAAEWVLKHAPEQVEPLLKRWIGDARRLAEA